jgi:arylsulfatase A-like enzyme
LREHANDEQPLFMGLGFFKPHLPLVATRADWEALANVDLPLPEADKPTSPYWHRSGEFYKYKAPFEKTQPLSAEAQLTSRRAYYACVRYVDRQVGRVLDALDELDMADNTVVVVWGDHGWHLGEQQVWAKHTPFERANRSVLLVRAPGVSQAGVKSSALVESIDLYPTLVELCQPKFTQTEQPFDGMSLLPILTGEQKAVRPAALSYWGDAISVRSEIHRLIVGKPRGGKFGYEALYDLSSDPDSMRDVSQEQHEQLELMRGYLP